MTEGVQGVIALEGLLARPQNAKQWVELTDNLNSFYSSFSEVALHHLSKSALQ
jgi:hypothetical protein